jgi:hypothetical protein
MMADLLRSLPDCQGTLALLQVEGLLQVSVKWGNEKKCEMAKNWQFGIIKNVKKNAKNCKKR